MRLLRLDAVCPHCRQPPRFRLADTERARYDSYVPEAVIGTFQCHRCHAVYDVRALSFQRAA